jgi:hypothetical protein
MPGMVFFLTWDKENGVFVIWGASHIMDDLKGTSSSYLHLDRHQKIQSLNSNQLSKKNKSKLKKKKESTSPRRIEEANNALSCISFL